MSGPKGRRAREWRPRIWFGLVGGAGAWFLHLNLSYLLVEIVCDRGGAFALHLVTGATAAVALAATWAAWSGLEPGTEASSLTADADGAPERRSFGALAGVLLSGFFLVLILVEGLPPLVLGDPCQAIPTPDRPIILAPSGPVTWASLMLHRPGGLVGPGGFWTAWNLDPWMLLVLLSFAGLYVRGVRALWTAAGRGRGIPRWRAACYLAGVWVLCVALVSPLDAVGEALFSVHMVQHLLLMLVAPPLLVAGRPLVAFLWGLPPELRSTVAAWTLRTRLSRSMRRALSHPATVFGLHVAALWAWHVPRLYEAALEHRALHLLEHASFFLTAMLFWWALARVGGEGHRWPGYGAGVLYVFATALQSGALGALLTFAPRAWYPSHAAGADLWGVDLLVDQQLAGVLMWVPAGIVYTGAAVVLFLAWLAEADRAVTRRERSAGGVRTRGPGPGTKRAPAR